MAKVTFYDALAGAAIGDIIDDGSLNIWAASPKGVTILDADHDGFSVTGTGLKVGQFGISAGTITGFRAFTSADESLMTIKNMSVDAAKLSMIATTVGLGAALQFMLKGNDTFIGSGNAELMVSGAGADLLQGNGDDDILAGSIGNDTLTGGEGQDKFVFAKGDGVDLITDFEDAGVNKLTDDHIVMKRSLFDTMVKTDAADGVHLDFAGNSTIILAGHTAAEITREDFIFV